jgi:hypothetical protein
MKRGKRVGRGDIPGQLQIDWSAPTCNGSMPSDPMPAAVDQPPMVQFLKWDFSTTFPQPTSEAIDAGVISDEDTTPEAIRSIHDEHAREALAVLHELDVVMDARRRGVDPRNNKPPMLQQARERLQKFFVTEPARLEHWWVNLMDVYEQSFGAEAADAFAKALRARHAGIPVMAEQPSDATPMGIVESQEAAAGRRIRRKVNRTKPHNIIARLPVPKPLPSAVAAGQFGQDEEGKPIRPGRHEVREITECHAERLIDLLDALASAPATGKDGIRSRFDAGITAYAEDFGQHAADQLAAYVKRQAELDPAHRRGR